MIRLGDILICHGGFLMQECKASKHDAILVDP